MGPRSRALEKTKTQEVGFRRGTWGGPELCPLHTGLALCSSLNSSLANNRFTLKWMRVSATMGCLKYQKAQLKHTLGWTQGSPPSSSESLLCAQSPGHFWCKFQDPYSDAQCHVLSSEWGPSAICCPVRCLVFHLLSYL